MSFQAAAAAAPIPVEAERWPGVEVYWLDCIVNVNLRTLLKGGECGPLSRAQIQGPGWR